MVELVEEALPDLPVTRHDRCLVIAVAQLLEFEFVAEVIHWRNEITKRLAVGVHVDEDEPGPGIDFDRFQPDTIVGQLGRSEEHTSEFQSLMRTSYAVLCLKKKKEQKTKR